MVGKLYPRKMQKGETIQQLYEMICSRVKDQDK